MATLGQRESERKGVKCTSDDSNRFFVVLKLIGIVLQAVSVACYIASAVRIYRYIF